MRALACYALLVSTGLAAAYPNPEELQARCAEQERQIAALEKEIGNLHSQIALERRLARGGAPAAVVAEGPAAKADADSAGKADTYKVRSGDTLSSIARRYGTTAKDLMADNDIDDPTRLLVGQELKVATGTGAKETSAPAPKEPEAKKPVTTAYTVKAGDTFYKIARDHSLTVTKLTALNPDVDPGRILVGQRLLVAGTPSTKAASVAKSAASTPSNPSTPKTISTAPPAPAPKKSPLPKAAPAPKPAPEPAPQPEAKAAPTIASIIVMEEISFGGFAKKHGTTPEQLNALNGLTLKDSTVLAKGSELYVPGR